MRILPGQPFPLGATYDGRGVNFALYSENATAVELCLVDKTGQETHPGPPGDLAGHGIDDFDADSKLVFGPLPSPSSSRSDGHVRRTSGLDAHEGLPRSVLA